MKYLLILFLLFNSIVKADDVVFLPAGESKNYDGYLFTPQKAQDVKNTLIERDGLLKLNESLQRSLNLQSGIIEADQKKIQLLLDQNDKLAQSLGSSQSLNNLERFGWFLVGVVSISVVSYGIFKVTR